MNDELVVAGSFPSPFVAGLARDRMEDEGIRAFVMDSEVAAMAWHLTNAIGGVKLYVAHSDLERAHEILEELEKHTYPPKVRTMKTLLPRTPFARDRQLRFAKGWARAKTKRRRRSRLPNASKMPNARITALSPA